MYGRRFAYVAVAALLMLGLIFAFGAASARQQAWMQGYMMGQMAADGGSQSVAPLMPYLGYGGGHMGWGGGFGSPFLFFGGILLVFLGLRFIFGGPGRRHGWSKHGEAMGQHGWPCPLWWSQQPPASSEETPESQPESED